MKQPAAWSGKFLGYQFEDLRHLELALTHRSYAQEHNERLEYLGDSVLGFVIAEALFQRMPDSDEGILTRQRALLVRGATLAEIARDLQLDTVLKLGGGEARSGGFQRSSILADTLESVFGAVLLDGGYGAVKKVILDVYAERLADLPSGDTLKDPKSRLQEALQAEGLAVPDYQLESESGPPHARRFEVSCVIADRAIKTAGKGSSRRAAEQEAATRALDLITDD